MSGSIQRFLNSNNVIPIDPLPIVHTTKSYRLRSIINNNSISLANCPIFGDDLVYFFFGRPSYKPRYSKSGAPYWMLPTCFIFDFSACGAIKRLYPFDTGAFVNKALPDYVTDLQLNEFALNNDRDTITKFAGAFFDSSINYLFLSNIYGENEFMKKFMTNILDPEILALRQLIADSSQEKFDDRRISIEIQFNNHIPLTKSKLLAVIAPEIYFANSIFLDIVKNKWNAIPLPYEIYPLSGDAYVSKIYELCFSFYKKIGVII